MALASLAAVAAGATAGIVVTAGDERSVAPQGGQAGSAASGPLFESINELVAKSDLVVVGR